MNKKKIHEEDEDRVCWIQTRSADVSDSMRTDVTGLYRSETSQRPIKTCWLCCIWSLHTQKNQQTLHLTPLSGSGSGLTPGTLQ